MEASVLMGDPYSLMVMGGRGGAPGGEDDEGAW
jgi:hypothetical protein